MIACPECFTENKDESKYCKNCGSSLINGKECSECGFENSTKSKYCVNCGTRIGGPAKQEIRRTRKPEKKSKKRSEPGLPTQTKVLVSIFGILLIAAITMIVYKGLGTNDDEHTHSTDEIIAAYMQRLERNPNDLEALINLGNIHFDNEGFQGAIFYYDRALQIDPTNPDVRVDMGIAYHRSGDSERGIEEFQKALEFNPKHINAHFNAGIVNYQLNRLNEASRWWRKFLELNPQGERAELVRQKLAEINGRTGN